MINFSVSNKEVETFRKWASLQKEKTGKDVQSVYIFTPTAIGTTIQVVNSVNGEYIDITDYESW